jgi:hypothetical protein
MGQSVKSVFCAQKSTKHCDSLPGTFICVPAKPRLLGQCEFGKEAVNSIAITKSKVIA